MAAMEACIDADFGCRTSPGVDPGSGWTLVGEEGFGVHRTDGAVHTTLWVAEWPLAHLHQLRADEVNAWLEADTTWQPPTQTQRMYGFAVLSDSGKQALHDRWKASKVNDNPS